jgi:hypothetical protein
MLPAERAYSALTESVRDEIRRLAAWGPVPPEPSWDDRATDLENFTRDAQRVPKPITDQERTALLALLDRPDDDSVYGLLDLIVTMLESSPDTGWQLALPTENRPWYAYLKIRYTNAQRSR